jgi:sulfite reductase alpha subunit-like flavoprotein
MVHINNDGQIDYKDLYEVETTYDDILNVISDINAPYALAEFIRMLPRYHSVAHVEDTNYEMAEDAQQIVESIRRYFEKKGVSQ